MRNVNASTRKRGREVVRITVAGLFGRSVVG